MLTAEQEEKIYRLVTRRLAKYPWQSCETFKNEPSFSARVLVPALAVVTQEFRRHGITVAGHGSSPIPEVQLGLLSFRPDGALLYRRQRLLAVEAKFLGNSGRQQALTQAIGQAVMYRAFGYKRVAIAVVDRAGIMSVPDAVDLSRWLASIGMGLLALTEIAGTLRLLKSS